MSHENENLSVPAQQLQRLRAVDAGVLNLVQQNDRGVANDDRVGNQQGSRLSSGELGHGTVQDERLPGQLIGESECLLHELIDIFVLPDASVCAQELIDRQVGKKVRVLGDEGNGCSGWREVGLIHRRVIDQHPPHGRCVSVREKLYVVDESRLPASGRAHDAHHIAHSEDYFLDGLPNTVLAISTEHGDLIYFHMPNKVFPPPDAPSIHQEQQEVNSLPRK